ncbi:MAG TPA: PQQ-dependent sugar dehydrogenase, partial [Steroidobacteraceae bacterium]|nr:PQQ-dependent sugar dehydrogenase [Steroidobacteraceae bacterium]
PFAGQPNARPEIWTLGHRNVQAAAFDPQGQLWEVEHGTNGGDELNRIEKGKNYGWPLVAYGEEYSGAAIPGAVTAKEGYQQPVYYWDPVIAPSGMTLYRGTMFPEWQGNIFVGGLVGMKLVRLQMDGDRVKAEEWFLQDLHARIRDVQQGVDGAIYVLTESGSDSLLVRIARQAGS